MKKTVKKPEPVGEMYDKISLWAAMYENRAPWLNEEVTGLGIPAAVAAELARLVTIEMKTAVTGGERAAFLDEAYQKAAVCARQFTETACAKGSVILKPYPKDGQIYIDYIQPEDFMPIAFDGDGNVTAAAFADVPLSTGVLAKFFARA